MGNTKHNIIPYVVFTALIFNFLATFMATNLDAGSIPVSLSYGLLLITLLGFVAMNFHRIYFVKTGFNVYFHGYYSCG